MLRVLEGGRKRALPPLLHLNGEILRLGVPSPEMDWVAGEWGRGAQHVSVRFVPRTEAPTWPSQLRQTQRCPHGSIPRVFCVGRWEDYWCAVLEPLRGESLARRLGGGRIPSQRWRFRLVWQLAFGVLSAHDAGLTGGSLDESTVWLTPEGYLKLPHFGEGGDPAHDRKRLQALAHRLNVDLSDDFSEWLPGFERKARRLSVYEPL